MAQSRWQEMLITVLFIGFSFAAAPAAAQAQSRALATAADLSSSLALTTRMVNPAVVEIFTTSYVPGDGIVPRMADLVTTQRASGSGVIVDTDGYILTNAHVVGGAQRLRVEISNSRRAVAGRIVGIDRETDLAVIKVEESNLTALAFGDSDELEAGQVVLAFGSPLGLHNSVSLGVVSAVARQMDPESPMVYVQTDASINPGSSGGPLVDLHGRIVGINTMIVTQAGGNEGLGFAAPSNIARTVYEQIRATGRVRRGDIGVRAQTVTPEIAAGLALDRDNGVILSDVFPGSPADRAKLQPGDLVLSINGRPVENGLQFQTQMYRHAAGAVVDLEVRREGRTLNVRLWSTERKDPFGESPSSLDPRENLVTRLGILGLNLDQHIAQMVPVVRVQSGVVVASTVDGALEAKDGGLATGDVIYAVNRTHIPGLAELRSELEKLKPGDPVVLQLERRGTLIYLAFIVE